MTRKLTEQEKKDFIEFEVAFCPICNGESITYGHRGYPTDDTSTQNASCNKCSAKWIETYTLTDVTLEDEGNGDPVHG